MKLKKIKKSFFTIFFGFMMNLQGKWSTEFNGLKQGRYDIQIVNMGFNFVVAWSIKTPHLKNGLQK